MLQVTVKLGGHVSIGFLENISKLNYTSPDGYLGAERAALSFSDLWWGVLLNAGNTCIRVSSSKLLSFEILTMNAFNTVMTSTLKV